MYGHSDSIDLLLKKEKKCVHEINNRVSRSHYYFVSYKIWENRESLSYIQRVFFFFRLTDNIDLLYNN